MSARETTGQLKTLVDRILPDVVDILRQAAAVARAAEEECATRGSGHGFALLLEQEAALQGAIALLRAMRYAQEASSASAPPASKRAKRARQRTN